MDRIYDESKIRSNYRKLTEALIKNHLTITTMESATSGQIASLITDTEGSSQVLRGAFVTYSNEAKVRCGVPESVIDEFSVYSLETAEAMAKACADFYQADIGIGITGTMGNIDPENSEASEVGRVYIGLYFRGEIGSKWVEIPPQESRLMYKLAAAEEVYKFIYEEVEL